MSSYNCGLNPFGDHVVVKLAEQETKKGELYIPKSAANENEPMEATVVAIGPGKEDVDMSVFTIGARVLFRQYSGTKFERDGEKYLVLRAGDVMCEVTE